MVPEGWLFSGRLQGRSARRPEKSAHPCGYRRRMRCVRALFCALTVRQTGQSAKSFRISFRMPCAMNMNPRS
ncbi:MAG: hypothetical protein J6C30_05210, partial [Lentisphaeria bacterium]|nr:hypothetical protein [Lentisphaeria bacterium]